MMADPEVQITGVLRETLAKLRAVSDDEQLGELMDAGHEHATFHTLVDTGVRGLDRYLLRDHSARIEPRGNRPSSKRARRRVPTSVPAPLGRSDDRELAERSLAVLDAALSCAAQCPDYESSLGVQQGLTHMRRRIHAAVECLGEHDHRGYLESLRESLCRELQLRSSHGGPQ